MPSADLVILDSTEVVEMAAEFKYEPSHKRNDIPSRKFSVVTWGYDGIAKDMERVREFVDRGKAKVAYAVFIDEGGHFHQKHLAPPGSEWKDWGNEVWVLSSRVLKL
jgi:hypothetical protein